MMRIRALAPWLLVAALALVVYQQRQISRHRAAEIAYTIKVDDAFVHGVARTDFTALGETLQALNNAQSWQEVTRLFARAEALAASFEHSLCQTSI